MKVMRKVCVVASAAALFLFITFHTADAGDNGLSINISLSKQVACRGDIIDVTVFLSGYDTERIGVIEVYVPVNAAVFSYVEGSAQNLVGYHDTDPVITAGYRQKSNEIYYSYVDIHKMVDRSNTDIFTFKLETISENINTIEEMTLKNTIIADTAINRVTYSVNTASIFVSGYHIDDVNGIISKVHKQTTVEEFNSSFTGNITAKVFHDTIEVENSTYVGTGMKVKLYMDDAEINAYDVCVTGDINGDGRINITDMISVNAHILKKRELTGLKLLAADTYRDGSINITDYIRILSDILGRRAIEPY